jgi:hypothetical protein
MARVTIEVDNRFKLVHEATQLIKSGKIIGNDQHKLTVLALKELEIIEQSSKEGTLHE